MSAQDHLTTQNGESSSVLTVKDGGFIYSTDENFNHQILEKKIIIAGSKITYTTYKGSKQIIVSNVISEKTSDKKFANRVQDALKKKKQDELKRLTKEIVRYESEKKHFENRNINIPFSTAQFYTYQKNTKTYIVPSSQKGIDKISGKAFQLMTQKALDFLYSKIDNHYNIYSLDYCFSMIYSVRPPPFTI